MLAAAIKSGAQAIVTRNMKDFPRGRLEQRNIKPKTPDNFVYDTIDIDPRAIWACIQQIVDSRTRHPVTIDDVIGELERDGLVKSAAVLRSQVPSG